MRAAGGAPSRAAHDPHHWRRGPSARALTCSPLHTVHAANPAEWDDMLGARRARGGVGAHGPHAHPRTPLTHAHTPSDTPHPYTCPVTTTGPPAARLAHTSVRSRTRCTVTGDPRHCTTYTPLAYWAEALPVAPQMPGVSGTCGRRGDHKAPAAAAAYVSSCRGAPSREASVLQGSRSVRQRRPSAPAG